MKLTILSIEQILAQKFKIVFFDKKRNTRLKILAMQNFLKKFKAKEEDENKMVRRTRTSDSKKKKYDKEE